MELLALILGVMLAKCVFVFGFLKKINDWRYVSRLGEKKHSLPPGDMGWPVFGKMLSFLKAFRSKDPDTFIHDLVRRYGRIGIYKTHLFGSPSIIVSTPEMCKKVLLDDERFKPGHPLSIKILTGEKSLQSLSNSEHKRLRRLTTDPINGHEALGMYIGYIEETVINSLEEWSSMNEPVEFLKGMRKITLKVITDIFVGSSYKSIIGSVEKPYSDLILGLRSAVIKIPGFTFYKALKARNTLVKILQGVLNERRFRNTLSKNDSSNEKRGMIDLLIENEDENGQKLSDEEIIDLLLLFLFAGHESSAHATMWATIYLHDHPEVLQKAKEEQDEILKKRSSIQKGLTLNEIREMNYLQKVIDETLRRVNISLSNFREATVDVNIGGYLIPKGWKVLVWNRAVHMDPQVYSNPKEFIPERWENNISTAGSFIPFGGGSRICPGANLAKIEMAVFLHYFLLNYKFEQINPGCPLVHLPVARPADNCLAKIMKVK